jgi:hypothetical protein
MELNSPTPEQVQEAEELGRKLGLDLKDHFELLACINETSRQVDLLPGELSQIAYTLAINILAEFEKNG